MINKNSQIEEIIAWQNFLVNQNFQIGSVDGIWGANTEASTKSFQIKNGLIGDGLIGSETIKIATSKGFEIPTVVGFNPVGHINAICDISHHIESVDFVKAKSDGLKAVFHKATQSGNDESPYHDKTYPLRRNDAIQQGLLWGAYHFGTGGSGIDQANMFLDYSKPNNDTLLVLDFERCTTAGETKMSLEEAEDFVNQIKLKTGKYPGIYGGSLLKELTNNNNSTALTNCWLWLAQYGPIPHLPNGWNDYVFWQYTDGNVGPSTMPIEGIGQCDREVFKGTDEELITFWNTNKV